MEKRPNKEWKMEQRAYRIQIKSNETPVGKRSAKEWKQRKASMEQRAYRVQMKQEAQ